MLFFIFFKNLEKATFMDNELQTNVPPAEREDKNKPGNFSLAPASQQSLREEDEDEMNSYDSDETSKINHSWYLKKNVMILVML